jgi:hypothetical protein
MRKMCLMIFLLMSVLLFQVSGANAGVIFSDNFNTENGGNWALNYYGFANWNITQGSVDLIGGSSVWNWFSASNGLYVDLDGSTPGPAGTMTSKILFPAGNYIFSFDLAGSQRSGYDNGNTVDVSFGSYVTSITKNTFDPFTTYNVGVTVPLGGSTIVFQNQGGDYVGALLDNVKVTAPLPSTLLLLGSSLAGLGLLRRKWNL